MAWYWNPNSDLDEPQQGSGGASKVQIQGVAITPVAPATASPSSSSSEVVAVNTARRGLIITNTGAINVYFSYGSYSAVVGSGIVLTAGGSWVMDSFTFSTLAINAICTSSSTLSIQEFQ